VAPKVTTGRTGENDVQDRSRADSLLDLAARVADLADTVLTGSGRTSP